MKAAFGVPAGEWPSAAECDAYVPHAGPLRSQRVNAWAASNSSLLSYLYPREAPASLADGWRAILPGCSVERSSCWCFHVSGASMVKARNPQGLKRCVPKDRVMDCSVPAAGVFYAKARRNCSCFAQKLRAPPCLFGDMRPAKLLAIIAACRAARVTHIIEQGRCAVPLSTATTHHRTQSEQKGWVGAGQRRRVRWRPTRACSAGGRAPGTAGSRPTCTLCTALM